MVTNVREVGFIEHEEENFFDEKCKINYDQSESYLCKSDVDS